MSPWLSFTTTPVAPPIVEQAPAAAVPGATIALGIVAAAALGGGIFTGLQSRRAAADLMGGLHTTDEVEALMRKQKLMGTLSLVGYGVSGAAAVGAVVTFFALRAKPGSVTVSASVGPDGALVMAGARF